MCSIDQKKQKGREGGKLEEKKKERKKKKKENRWKRRKEKKKKIKTVYIFFNLINENVILPIHMN